MALVLILFLLLSVTSSSCAMYCVCMDELPNKTMQTNIDYACGSGADCTPILPDGACFQPDTLKAHCDFAVNSYFYEMGQVPGSCNFGGSAFMTNTLPRTTIVLPGCIYSTHAGPRHGEPQPPPSPNSGPDGPSPHHERKGKIWSRLFKYIRVALKIIGAIVTLALFCHLLRRPVQFLFSCLCSDLFDDMIEF